ncbi:LysR family transcriptional regulator [Thauera mechernichensis]|uniref:LysR family transcriptional regulator n=1 Tax=Thauera mechernichensis TaxID=82788 RepID=A0ABW3WBL7_9RHOO|nr:MULTISPECIES: LysR family transcriptional regulator [Thauera]MDG3065344.1 LysR family transcriptional regulator [Thauera mechernichensis]WBL62578.1 LysR family transcriptional regulator [Thauera sp. WB-2]HAG74947.1 LysR family transcriptional regulator [Thauera sp.]HAY09068.1 LysR family transcriptional regulator [Thauera sp.]HNR59799.1 LysR family transcriptional regulator [Thauera sp.]
MADRRLQVFHAVAKHGSFTRAAEHLHMTQPAVTFQIKQLEEHFDTRLLDRGHGKISLTPAGELVLAYAERILGLSAELDSRVSELTDELAGQIKIGTSTTIAAYWLPHILEGFKRRYPRVLPRVVVGNSKLTEDAVAARDLDIGLIEIVTEQHAIERRSAARDELFVICSPDNPLAAFKSLRAKDLVGHPFIDRDPGNGIRQIADEFFEAAGIAGSEITLCAEIGSLATIKHLAAAGLGFAIASKRAIQRDLEDGRLVAIALEPRIYTPLEVILPRDKFRSRLITAFADFACEEFARMADRDSAA